MKIDLTRKNLVIELKESIKLENDQFIDKCINLVNKKYSISNKFLSETNLSK